MLKRPFTAGGCAPRKPAAFGRLCVETLHVQRRCRLQFQPPSGGCVLKHIHIRAAERHFDPAAFGRLCVETLAVLAYTAMRKSQPPSGGCVLKPAIVYQQTGGQTQPPSGGCVLKPIRT